MIFSLSHNLTLANFEFDIPHFREIYFRKLPSILTQSGEQFGDFMNQQSWHIQIKIHK
jgi:hypothetical protein